MIRRFVLILLALSAQQAAAHDFWVEPSSFRPRVGDRVQIALRVGEDFDGDPMPRDPSIIVRFDAVDSRGPRPIPGFTMRDPAGVLQTDAAESVVVAYESRLGTVELSPDTFARYVREEGLVVPKLLDSTRTVHEVFMRCAKSVIAVGEASPKDRTVGLPLEITVQSFPTESRRLDATVAYQSKPLANAMVAATNRRNPLDRRTARTDARGRVSLDLGDPGPWLLTAVHLVAAPKGSGGDWMSLWASLTFE